VKRGVEFSDNSANGGPVRGFLHRPESRDPDGLVLTHGAGSDCRSALLVALAEAFYAAGWMVLRCDLPFRQARPHGPPIRGAGERDQGGLRAAVTALRLETAGRIYLGGHSYGGRQGSMLAAAAPEIVDALLLLSYPLHPPQRPDVMRTAHLPDLRTPTLFVHGTSDEFGTIAEMKKAIRLIPGRTGLLEIAGAGHELMTRKNRGQVGGLIARTFIQFTAG